MIFRLSKGTFFWFMTYVIALLNFDKSKEFYKLPTCFLDYISIKRILSHDVY